MITEFECRIGNDAVAALRSTGYAELPHLRIRVVGRDVHLMGRLPSYYLKQKAHCAVLSVPGVASIIDDINVVSRNRGGSQFLSSLRR